MRDQLVYTLFPAKIWALCYQVIGLALFYALVIKTPSNDEDVDPGLEKGQEYLHKHEKQCQKLDHTIRKKLNKYKNVPIPPTEEYLAAARAMRYVEINSIDPLLHLKDVQISSCSLTSQLTNGLLIMSKLASGS